MILEIIYTKGYNIIDYILEAAMNKKLSMLLPVIATCGLLAGCGTDYYTKDSTVFVAKNGSVVSTDVEDFDTAAYKQDDLQSYVDSFNRRLQ